MKRKLSKAGGKALSVALAMATVVSAAPFSVAAEDNVALAQTQDVGLSNICYTPINKFPQNSLW